MLYGSPSGLRAIPSCRGNRLTHIPFSFPDIGSLARSHVPFDLHHDFGNREERLDTRHSHSDLQINLLAEQENTKMLMLLEAMATKIGVDPSDDPDVEVLEQATRPEKLVEQIEASEAFS